MIAHGFEHPMVFKSVPIVVNGNDTGVNGRGFNVVVISAEDGIILKGQAFDTYSDIGASGMMIQFIDSSPAGSILAIVVQDEGSEKLTQSARDYITSLGSRYVAGLSFRDTLALVTAKGVPKPPWFAEDRKRGGDGSSSLNVRIWL